MNIISNDKIELRYDKYEMVYILTVYDKYGHYIDDVSLSKEEMKDLCDALELVKNNL